MPNKLTQRGHGFIPDVITPDHYMLGGGLLPTEVLQPDHSWLPFSPPDKFQNKNGLETMNCTVYGTLRAIRTLLKRKFDLDVDYSERYVGIETNTSATGNSPHVVAETIRKVCGLLDDSLLPFSNDITTWPEYYSPKPMLDPLLVQGKKFIDTFDFGHEWVFDPSASLADKQIAIKEALKYSPLGVSVYAWSEGQDALYHKAGPDNHWTVLVDYEEGDHWLIYDDYDQTHKMLAWDFDFGMCKRYTIERKLAPVPTPWHEAVCEIFANIFNFNNSITKPA